VEKYEGVKRHLKDIILNNFLGGIAWAFGATVGLALVITLLSFLLRQINLVPFIGDFASKITSYVLLNLQNSPQLVK